VPFWVIVSDVYSEVLCVLCSHDAVCTVMMCDAAIMVINCIYYIVVTFYFVHCSCLLFALHAMMHNLVLSAPTPVVY
jgi:hypothetical protein